MACFEVANTQLQNPDREVCHLCERLRPCVTSFSSVICALEA